METFSKNMSKYKNVYSVNDVYSMDKHENYLDDLCDYYYNINYESDYNDY